jgi:hypothetical protein
MVITCADMKDKLLNKKAMTSIVVQTLSNVTTQQVL